jgi:hypothetical protein
MEEIRLNLPGDQWTVLNALCARTGRPMASLIRLGLSLAKLALEETEQHHILIIATPEGKALHQVVIPENQASSAETAPLSSCTAGHGN